VGWFLNAAIGMLLVKAYEPEISAFSVAIAETMAKPKPVRRPINILAPVIWIINVIIAIITLPTTLLCWAVRSKP